MSKTAYQEFIQSPGIKKGVTSLLWELEVNQKIDDLLQFTREFLSIKGYSYTGYNQEFKAIFNNCFVFGGAIQEGNKIAIRINKEAL